MQRHHPDGHLNSQQQISTQIPNKDEKKKQLGSDLNSVVNTQNCLELVENAQNRE
jgi:hypothetical protein